MLVNCVHKRLSLQVVLVFHDVALVESEHGQILGEMATLNSLNSCILERLSEESKFFISVELGTVKQSSCPRKDRCDRISRCAASLLVGPVVTSHGTVGCLSLQHVVSINTHRRHQAERAEALGYDVRHHIAVVILTRPNEATTTLYCLSNKIINETVLIVESCLFKLSLVVFLVLLLEDIHKKSVVFLQNRVFS